MSIGAGPNRAGGLYVAEFGGMMTSPCGGASADQAGGTPNPGSADASQPAAPSTGSPLCVARPTSVPGSGFGSAVLTQRVSGITGIPICGLLVTCAETGVTLISDGTSQVFYSSTSGTASFSTPGGVGGECPSSSGHTYSSGSVVSTFDPVPYPINRLNVTQTS